MSPARDNKVTVGIDIGTTSVKGLAVSGDGDVVARVQVPHRVIVEAADRLEHDARRAWRAGPVRAFNAVRNEAASRGYEVAGFCVTSMVPSLTAVNKAGVPTIPGLLYGDIRGRVETDDQSIAMRDAEGFLRWAITQAPNAAGYWPAQAVATNAIGGIPAIDTAMTASLGSLHSWGKWDLDYLSAAGVDLSHMPEVVPMGQSAGTISGTDIHIAGGSVDALCDQIVSGATEVGDVLVIVGATLIVWIVIGDWRETPGLWTVPHTVPDRVLVGGPSNAGALFVDWARGLVTGLRKHGAVSQPGRSGDPDSAPIWLPYLRGERVPFHDPDKRSCLYDLDITSGPPAMERAAYEASGFVIRRMLDMAGVKPRRLVVSGGGSRVLPWMAALADATGAPVETVAVPEGAALGASYLARMAAGLASDLDGAQKWAKTGRRIEPDPVWVGPTYRRYQRFLELSPYEAPAESESRD
ncbi:MAG: FGGY-family carbohydrate kinase [Acidimicrobiales bacterium]